MPVLDAHQTRPNEPTGPLDQALALLGESMHADFVCLQRDSGQTRWVARDLPNAQLPSVERTEWIPNAHTAIRYARHPVVTAGISTLLVTPVRGSGCLWLGAVDPKAFNASSTGHLERWAQLLEGLRPPEEETTAFRRVIATMASPALYVRGDAVFLNRGAEKLTGYTAEELPTLEVWFERLYGADGPMMRAMCDVDRQCGFGSSRVTALRCKDGTERMVEVAAQRDGAHEVWLLVDATERVSAQERFRVLFEQSSTPLSLYDESGVIDCNPAAVTLLGYTAKADVLRKKPASFSPPLQPDGQASVDKLAMMETIALTQGSHRFDWAYQTENGQAQVEVTLTPLMLGARPVLLADWHDISQRLRYQEGLRAARDSAMAYAKAKSDFISTMSHEIRTPMNGVIGMAQMLAETSLTQAQREYVDTVRGCGEGLVALINDVLDYSQLEAGTIALESAPLSVRQVVEEAAALLAPLAHGKGLELICALEPSVPGMVWGDAVRLKQMLLNLLSNAVKFTAKGLVGITVTSKPSQGEETVLEFVVRDSGVGISPENMPRLFAAFSQHDTGTARRYGGSGLGLVICKGIATLMKGKLEVESSPEGSAFKVILPMKVHTQTAPRVDLSGRTIALLEQRPASRAALMKLLAMTRATVSTPENEQALGKTDLVLIDQGFDQENGIALAARLASEGRQVGLLRRADGSVTEISATFVLPTPVRESMLFEQLGRQLLPLAAGPETKPPVQKLHGARVLVAEDNRVNQRVVRGLLERLGCAVTIVDNGLRAVETFSETAFDLVLMDCQMPELDGFGATQRIRAKELNHIPIVALTAGAIDGGKERCLAAGMDAYLNKPVRIEELERALNRWLP